jgi:hypothetical protein
MKNRLSAGGEQAAERTTACTCMKPIRMLQESEQDVNETKSSIILNRADIEGSMLFRIIF